MHGTTSAGAGPAEGMKVPLTTPRAPELALASPDERRGIGVPAACRRFEPVYDVIWGGRGLTRERAADEDALDRLSEPMLLHVL